MAMKGVALQCIQVGKGQVGKGWGEWASQVEHSITREQGVACGYAHPFVRVSSLDLRFSPYSLNQVVAPDLDISAYKTPARSCMKCTSGQEV